MFFERFFTKLASELFTARGQARQLFSLFEQVTALHTHGELDEAMRLYKELEHLSRKFGNRGFLATSLNGQAQILQTHGELDEAMRLYKEAKRFCPEFGNRGLLANPLNGQAQILETRGELDEAMQL